MRRPFEGVPGLPQSRTEKSLNEIVQARQKYAFNRECENDGSPAVQGLLLSQGLLECIIYIYIRMIQKQRQYIETIYNTTSTKQNLQHRGKRPLHRPLDRQILLLDPCVSVYPVLQV